MDESFDRVMRDIIAGGYSLRLTLPDRDTLLWRATLFGRDGSEAASCESPYAIAALRLAFEKATKPAIDWELVAQASRAVMGFTPTMNHLLPSTRQDYVAAAKAAVADYLRQEAASGEG